MYDGSQGQGLLTVWTSTQEAHSIRDGLSLVLLALTAFLGAAAVLASWKGIRARVGAFHLCLGAVLAGVNGVFLATDLFLFAFFWELMLVPMFFLIDVWGHGNRHRAARALGISPTTLWRKLRSRGSKED